MAALRAPSIETAATGTPGGIWTMDKSESRPPANLVSMGTAMTGNVVNEAVATAIDKNFVPLASVLQV